MNFIENLKELRKEKNLSQFDLSEKTKITRATISNWEQGRCEPSIDDLIKLAKFFAVSIDYLVGKTNDFTISADVSTLSYKEKTLLKFFNLLNENTQDQVIDYTKYQADKFINLNELKRS